MIVSKGFDESNTIVGLKLSLGANHGKSCQEQAAAGAKGP